MAYEKIDIKDGEMSFGQRILLGKVLGHEIAEDLKFKQVFAILHPSHKLAYSTDEVIYFGEIIEGILAWIEEEKKLDFKLSQEDIKAGAKEIQRELGEWATLISLSRSFSKDPDDVLNWEYAKVFKILQHDMIQAKVQRRKAELQAAKYKKQNRRKH